jgi:hypothetical protein
MVLNGHSVNKTVIAYASMNINPSLMIKEINIAIGTCEDLLYSISIFAKKY